MKRFFLAVIVFLLLVSGCSQKVVNNIDSAQVKEIQKPIVNLQFASWGSKTEVAVLRSIIADFEAQNPDIKIEFLHIPQNYFQKIHLLFASNNTPDVIFMNNQFLPIYANAGKLEPIKYDTDIYDGAVVEALSWNKINYVVPRDISVLVVYYNKDLFDRANVTYPDENWTQRQMLKKALKIKKKTGAFGISFEEEPLFYLPYVMSEGGSFYDLEDKQTQKGLKFYANLRLRHKVAPTRTEIGSATMAQMFLQEKIAMHVSGRWLTPKYLKSAKFSWGIVDFPSGSKKSLTPLDASGWALAKSSQNKEEALRFINYLASKKSINKFTQTGLIVPARNDIDFLDSQIYRRVIEKSIPTPVSIDYNKILDKLKIQLEPIFNK